MTRDLCPATFRGMHSLVEAIAGPLLENSPLSTVFSTAPTAHRGFDFSSLEEGTSTAPETLMNSLVRGEAEVDV